MHRLQLTKPPRLSTSDPPPLPPPPLTAADAFGAQKALHYADVRMLFVLIREIRTQDAVTLGHKHVWQPKT